MCKLLEAKECCGYPADRKRFDVAAVLPLKTAATERAERLAKRHGEVPLVERNPGSSVHLLLAALDSGSPRR